MEERSWEVIEGERKDEETKEEREEKQEVKEREKNHKYGMVNGSGIQMEGKRM